MTLQLCNELHVGLTFADGARQSWTSIGSIHGLDWIGSNDCNPLFFHLYILHN